MTMLFRLSMGDLVFVAALSCAAIAGFLVTFLK